MNLEKIISGVKSIKEAGKFVKDVCILAKDNPKALMLLGSLMAGNVAYGIGEANPGYLKIKNSLNSKNRSVTIRRDDGNFFGATDGYDSYDGRANSQPSGYPNCYSDIFDGQLYHLWTEFRAEDSNVPYDIKLGFQGTLTTSQPNWLEFNMPLDGNPELGEYHFGNKPIIFESNRLPYGEVVDVKKAMATQNNGVLDSNAVARVDLIDVPAGTYNQWTPYGSGILEIGTRLLADLNDDGVVNNFDYTLLAGDYGKPQGKYIGDISGPNGIPDGNVNYWDLGAFCDSYLADVNTENF